MNKHIQRYLRGDAPLDERVYVTLVSMGVISSFFTILLSLIVPLGLGLIAHIICAFCAVWFAALQLLGHRHPERQYVCRVMLVLGLSFLIFPLGFFCVGGTAGGGHLLYLLGIFNIVILLKKPLRSLLVLSQIFLAELTIYLSHRCPDLVAPLSQWQQHTLTYLLLFICCVTLANMMWLILKCYDFERSRTRALTEQLSILSARDPLTGLYNRRELFRRLELIFQPGETHGGHGRELSRAGCYIAMFDVDNFKHLNDTFGHQCGDTVLDAIAGRLKDVVDPSAGELAARYGGEEFVLVLYASSVGEAFARLDVMRQSVGMLEWSESRFLHVTLSGGLVACEQYDELDRAMHDVDALLYQAKHSGKDRIETQLRSTFPQKRV